jgi:hypothetical protein
VIDARLAQEKVQEMRTLVDLRFGPGTWQGIMDERAKRIREAKEAAEKARQEALRERAEFMESLKLSIGISAIVAAIGGLFIFLLTIA